MMTYSVNEEMIKRFADAIMNDIRHYREVRDDSSFADEPKWVSMAELMEKTIAGSSYDSAGYWRKAIESKLAMVNIIGGLSLANRVLRILEDEDERIIQNNDNGGNHTVFNYVSAFDTIATGTIKDWIS